jgi:hypothetical protein
MSGSRKSRRVGGVVNDLQRALDKIVNIDNERSEEGVPTLYDEYIIGSMLDIAKRAPRWMSPKEKETMKTLLNEALENKDITPGDHKVALVDLEERPLSPTQNNTQDSGDPQVVSEATETAKDGDPTNTGSGRRRSQTAKFNRCVKSVRKTVKARKGSTKESAAIGICVKSVLHKRGRTLKRYSKKRLVTQKRK